MRTSLWGLIILLAIGLSSAGNLSRSGNFLVDTDAKTVVRLDREIPAPFAFLDDTVEVLVNPGFETGTLPPWYGTAWEVVAIDSHTGQYCAADVGNNYIRQDLDTILTDSIISINFWARQPEAQIQAFDFLYSDNTYYESIVFETASWQQFDVTSYLPSGKYMIALRFWGYSGGPPGIDSSYMDDISLMKVTPSGKVEEILAPNRRLEFSVNPNPVRDRATITYLGLKNENPRFSIYDPSGAVVERAVLNNGRYVWSTNGLVSGVYFVRVDCGVGKPFTKEVLVIK